MKSILALLLFFLSSNYAYSELRVQLGTGSITPHFSGSKKNYCNQWNNTGIIANKTYYFSLYAGNFGMTYLVGNDSICSEIEGLFLYYSLNRQQWWDLGIQFGGYAYNEKNWILHAEKTPSGIDAPEPVTTDFHGRAVVPVLALAWNIHLVRRDSWSLKLNNMLTPIITNHSLAFEFRF